MKKGISLCLLMCGVLLFSGCLGGVPETDTIAVDRKGRITWTIVEDFDKAFYDAAELEAEIEEELADYNKNFASDHIRMETFEVEDGVATLQLFFDASRYYADYTGVTLFADTISEAEDEGWDLSGEYMSADGSLTDAETEADGKDIHVLILEESVHVKLPGKILAWRAGDGRVTLDGSREADVTAGDAEIVILYQ